VDEKRRFGGRNVGERKRELDEKKQTE